MRTTRFFRFVWQIDAVIILLVGLFTLVLLTFLLNDMVGNQPSTVVTTAAEKKQDEEFKLGRFVRIGGGRYLWAPLYSGKSGYWGSLKGASLSVRNYLFLNMDDMSSHWLFSGREFLIIRADLLSKVDDAGLPDEERTKRVIGILCQVVRSDTDGDDRLSETDKLSIVVSDANGHLVLDVVDNVDRFLGYEMADEDTLVLMYEKDGTAHSVKWSLGRSKLINRVELQKRP